MNVLVIDGQGGGIGKQLVASIKKHRSDIIVTAVGTNTIATSAMMKAGADYAATGENAIIVNSIRSLYPFCRSRERKENDINRFFYMLQ